MRLQYGPATMWPKSSTRMPANGAGSAAAGRSGLGSGGLQWPVVADLGDGRQPGGDLPPALGAVVAGEHVAGRRGGEQAEAAGMAGQTHSLDVAAHVLRQPTAG